MHRRACLVMAGLLACVAGQQREEELQSLLHDTDVNRAAPRVGSASNDDDFEVEFEYTKTGEENLSTGAPPLWPAKRRWGVPDSAAWVGKVFSSPIPADAFEGNISSYQFDLPPWLSYSRSDHVIEGVPSPQNVGTLYVAVVALGEDGSRAMDTFAVNVTNIPGSTLLKEARCSPKQELTVLSIILEPPSTALQPRDKVQLIYTVSRILNGIVKTKEISLLSSPALMDPLDGNTAIMAGPGRYKARSSYHSRPSDSPASQMLLQWSVGCDGDVGKGQEDVVRKIEVLSKKGKLESEIDIPVVGWMVTQVNPSTKRVRRDVDYSGDYSDPDDYDYDYENFNFPPIPSLATPVLPHSPATVHLDKSLVSPVFKAVPLSTPVYIPVKPTRVVEASPTVAYETEYPFAPFVDPDLESSLLTHPTTSGDYTTPLTMTPTALTEPTKHESVPIKATAVPAAESETTEIGVKNFPPRIRNRIKKMAWIAGSLYRMQIPEDSFIDTEDGGTRSLTLVLKDEMGEVFNKESWIHFDPTKQEVYALPLENHIGSYHFRLEAMDKDRKVVSDHLEISVRQHTQARLFHHQFTAMLKLEKKYEYEFAFALDWQVRAVEKIAALFKDTLSNINVRKITTNPIQISWTNTSLINSHSTTCPKEELEKIAEVMLSGHGPAMTQPSREASRVFLPEFQLKKIHSRFYDPCESQSHPHHTRPETGHSPTLTGGATPIENSPPLFRNQIDLLEAAVGHLYRYQVPDNTCYDMENGNSRNLKLKLMTIDLTPPSDIAWLQFDSANQEFFGLPLKENEGRVEYVLECMDKGGMAVSDVLIVKVTQVPDADSPKPVLFSLSIDADFKTFMANAHSKARFLDRLGQAFGDAGAEYLAIRELKEGSVKVEWHNNSLPNHPCPTKEVQALRNIMTDENGHLSQEFKDFFLPDFSVTSGVSMIPSGSCLAADTPTYPEESDVAPSDDEEVVSPRDEDYLVTFVAPAVIIAAMLLLAALIACCLYRRRRYGKMSMAGDRTFVSKGIPIIFAEELDDHRPDAAKSPVIMKEEKPPLPPPEYQRGSPPRTTGETRRPPSGDMNQPPSDDAPYHRPPPFTASNGGSRNQRPNLPPAYRKPPTYVPP